MGVPGAATLTTLARVACSLPALTLSLRAWSVPRHSFENMPPISTLPSACPSCGAPWIRDDDLAECKKCRPSNRVKPVTRQRTRARLGQDAPAGGYDARWRKLSRRARQLQPFCSHCGSTDDLTADHSPEAWRRHAAGLPIRLRDVDVLCRRCNTDAGPARGPNARERDRRPLPDLDQLDQLDAEHLAGDDDAETLGE